MINEILNFLWNQALYILAVAILLAIPTPLPKIKKLLVSLKSGKKEIDEIKKDLEDIKKSLKSFAK